jgi:hypothetical protein
MAFNLGGIGSTAMGALMSWGFWLIMAVVVVAVIFGSLWMRRKGKFIFPAIIFTDNGNGKVGIKFTRAGWFKSKKILGGLLDISGERRLETKDKRIIQQGSSSDLHEINFKAGLMLREKEDDPKILVPVSKCELSEESEKMIMEIAPADYRDACSKIISDAERESMSNWQTVAQVLVFGLVAVVLFISIILTIQYAKNSMTEANQIHKDALSFYDKVLARTNVAPSNAP